MDTLPAIELRYLRYFVAVAEEMNFRKAAERLHITGPALSMQIKKLEELLDVQLCERSSSSKMRLTPAGKSLLKEARDLLENTKILIDHTKAAASESQGCLRIGGTQLFNQCFIMETVKEYQLRYPAECVDWVEVDKEDDLTKALEEGYIQLGFAFDFQIKHIKQAERLLIMDSPVRVVMGVHHPLAEMEELPLEILVKQKLLCFEHSWFDFQDLPELFRNKHLSSKNFKRIHGCNTCMIAGVEGMTLLPEKQAATLCAKMVHRPIKGLGANGRVRLYAVWKKHGESQKVLNFLKLLKEFDERKVPAKN